MIEDGDVWLKKKIDSGEENMRVLLNRVRKLRVLKLELCSPYERQLAP